MTILLKILASPLTWALALGAAAIGGIWWLAAARYDAGLDAGRAEVRAEWSAAALKAEQDKRAAEQALAARAAEHAATAAAEIEKAKTEAQEAINAYTADLARQPADARCALSGDDVRRLRDIQSGRAGAAGD